MQGLGEFWLKTDVRRVWATSVVATVLAVPLITWLVFAISPSRSLVAWFSILITWTLFAMVHALLTWLAHRRKSGEELARLVAEPIREQGRLERSRVFKALSGSGDAPSWAVQLSVMAVIGVVALIASPALRQHTLAVALGVVLVAATWIDVAVRFAVQYAKVDLATPSLVFPGETDRSFSDYLYFAIGVQATMGPTDVQIAAPHMRRLVTRHSLIAFIFSTVIVAIVVSLLLSGI